MRLQLLSLRHLARATCLLDSDRKAAKLKNKLPRVLCNNSIKAKAHLWASHSNSSKDRWLPRNSSRQSECSLLAQLLASYLSCKEIKTMMLPNNWLKAYKICHLKVFVSINNRSKRTSNIKSPKDNYQAMLVISSPIVETNSNYVASNSFQQHPHNRIQICGNPNNRAPLPNTHRFCSRKPAWILRSWASHPLDRGVLLSNQWAHWHKCRHSRKDLQPYRLYLVLVAQAGKIQISAAMDKCSDKAISHSTSESMMLLSTQQSYNHKSST